MYPFHATLALVTAAVAALLAPVSSTPAAAAAAAVPAANVAGAPSLRRDLPKPPPAEVARKELGELTVAAPHPMTGYSRSKFPHWVAQHGPCDTREVVLQRDGQDVVQNDQCRAVSGTGTAPTTGRFPQGRPPPRQRRPRQHPAAGLRRLGARLPPAVQERAPRLRHQAVGPGHLGGHCRCLLRSRRSLITHRPRPASRDAEIGRAHV